MKKLTLMMLVALATTAAGCFRGPGNLPDPHSNDDVPIVEVGVPQEITDGAPFVSRTIEIPFTVYDPDSDFVRVWDRCPYAGAEPILTIAYSIGGGYQQIDPASLQIDGADLVVPTCDEVLDGTVSTIAVNGSGMDHVLTWESVNEIPDAGDVRVRINVNDGSWTSDPGTSEEFTLVNAPYFATDPEGLRPGDSLTMDLIGALTSWDGTTTASVDSASGLTLGTLTVTSTSSATLGVTAGGGLDEEPIEIELTTPGAGVPSGDEVATGLIWGCSDTTTVTEYETNQIGDVPQFICDRGTFTVNGTLGAAGDVDLYSFVANSSGMAAMSLSWSVAADFDAWILNSAGELMLDPAPFGVGGCGTEANPETCTLNQSLTPGELYFLVVSIYAGATGSYTATVTP